MKRSGRKTQFKINENVTSEEIYALLDDVDTDKELDIDSLLNDSYSEYILEEKI